jgi:AraC family transcriptional regulator of arabinose operon
MQAVENYAKISNPLGIDGSSFAFVYRRLSLENFSGTFHTHQGMEFLYVHEGKGQLTLEQKTYKVSSGMLLYFQPFQLHQLQMEVTRDSPFIRSIVVFEPSLLDPYLTSLRHLQNFFRHMWHDTLDVKFIEQLEDGNDLDLLLRQFHRSFSTPWASNEEKFEETILFLINFLRTQRPYWQKTDLLNDTAVKHPSHPVEEIIQWIEQHYSEEFRLETLASALHLSPFYLSRLFHTATGSSITRYITARRIREACLLLQASSLSISAVGQAVGLNNPSYFNQLFKKATGITPHQYRLNALSSNR